MFRGHENSCYHELTLFLSVFLQQIKAISEAGCSVIVAGGKVGELAQHYCNKYKILVVRLMSKWDLRRLCRSIEATPLPRIVSLVESEIFKHVKGSVESEKWRMF